MASLLVSKGELAYLKCSACGLYLSCGPVTVNPNGSFNCGRCSSVGTSGDRQKPRSYQFEILAKHFKFPCIYESSGCYEKINFDSSLAHETTCEFRPIRCPVQCCEEKVSLNKMEPHFVAVHADLLAKDLRFKMNQDREIVMFKFFRVDDLSLFLQVRTRLDENCSRQFDLVVTALNQTPNMTEYTYGLKVTSAEGRHSFCREKHHIVLYKAELEWNYSKTNMISLDFNSLQVVLDASDDFNFEVYIQKKDQKKDQYDPFELANFLDELECMVCKEYMRPPISMCKTGHSICTLCRNKLTYCPTCRANFEGTRNYNLEKMLDRVNIKVSCLFKNSGCTWSGKPAERKQHEETCIKRPMLSTLSTLSTLSFGRNRV